MNNQNNLTEQEYKLFNQFLLDHGWLFRMPGNWEAARYYHAAWPHPIIINNSGAFFIGNGDTFKLWATLFKNYQRVNSQYMEHLQRNL